MSLLYPIVVLQVTGDTANQRKGLFLKKINNS